MLKVGFLIEKRYLQQEITRAVTRAFEQRGSQVDVICPMDCQFEPGTGALTNRNGIVYHLNRYDVLIPRIRSALGLALLSYAQAAGIQVVNSFAAVQKARNKTEVAVALEQAGVPTAPTILADDASVLYGLSGEWYPLILKAVYGDNSQGLRLIRKPEELDLVSWGGDLVLAQHYIANDGYDLKLYASGNKFFASRKPSPFNGDPRAQFERIQPDSDMITLTRQVGAVLGLEIYGVDAIQTPAGPVVIEVNDFPNFTGIRGAADVIVDHVLAISNRLHIRAPRTVPYESALAVLAAAGA